MRELEGQVLDHVILFFLTAVLFVGTGVHIEAVIAVLCAICLSGLMGYLSGKKGNGALMAVAFVLCLSLPGFMYFFPVFLYHGIGRILEMGFMCQKTGFARQDESEMAAARIIWIVCTIAEALVLFFFMKESCALWKVFLWCFLFGLACMLCYRTKKIVSLEQEMIRLRDTSTELNLVLEEKNKYLMEKQDYEIYLATLRERNRIAREIHDNVGHLLSRLILQVGALMVIQKDSTAKQQLNGISETLNQAMNSIRESVHDLHDDAVDLKQAVMEAVRPIRESCEVTVDYDMSGEVPSHVKYCLIAVVKEAAANIIKHSNACEVNILLREHPGLYQLEVEDNGDLEEAQKSSMISRGTGIGLKNMEERVNALNGTFRVKTENGVQIFVSVPKQQSQIRQK